MSALQAPLGAPQAQPATPKPTRLRAVPDQQQRLSRLPFMLIVAVLLGGGMVGVLLLSTTIQAQSAELSALQAQESELSYQEAALVAIVQDLRSSQNLADRAWELGMRPNPNPAFIMMPDGTVVGAPSVVTGDELPGMAPPAPPAPPPAETPAAEAPAEAPAADAPPAEAPPAEAPPAEAPPAEAPPAENPPAEAPPAEETIP